MSERGVFAIDRGWFDHPSFPREPFTHREAWAWLISEAAFKPVTRRVGSVTVSLERGQLAHSLRFMADKWQWSEPKVRRFLTRLKTDAMALVSSDAGVTVVTVCNYSKYQRVSLPRDAASDAQTDAAATQQRRKEEDTKYSNDDLDAGAPAKLVSDSSFEIATEIGALCGFSEPLEWPPGWAGAPMRVQAWLNEGWHRDHIIGGVREAMAKKRDGPPHSINYFDKPIASFVGKQLAPLPEVRIQERETINVIRDAKADAKSEFRAAHAGLRQFVARNRSGEGREAVRLLQPPGDRGRSDIPGGGG